MKRHLKSWTDSGMKQKLDKYYILINNIQSITNVSYRLLWGYLVSGFLIVFDPGICRMIVY